jgi:hypothetical protein
MIPSFVDAAGMWLGQLAEDAQMKFQVNEGPIDRLIRVALGVVLFAVAASGLVTAPVLYGVLLVGTIGLVTGVTGFCPTYVLLGISTIPKNARQGAEGR